MFPYLSQFLDHWQWANPSVGGGGGREAQQY